MVVDLKRRSTTENGGGWSLVSWGNENGNTALLVNSIARRKAMIKKRLQGLTVCAVVLVVSIAFAQKIELDKGQIDLINSLQNQKLIDIAPGGNQVYIDPGLWAQMDYKLKTNVASALAVYCSNRRDSTSYWLDIFDRQTGKKIAKYSQSMGALKVY